MFARRPSGLPLFLWLLFSRRAAREQGRRPAFSVWASLRRERRQLSRLDDRLLDDIGLSRSAACEEAGRPFWDAPLHWRQ